MPSYSFSSDGKTHTHLSAEEAAAAFVFCLIAVPFLPILAAGYFTFKLFHEQLSWHPVFSIIVAVFEVGSVGWILYNFRILRVCYFIAVTIAGTIFIFYDVNRSSDAIWASAASVVTLGIGALYTWAAATFEDWR